MASPPRRSFCPISAARSKDMRQRMNIERVPIPQERDALQAYEPQILGGRRRKSADASVREGRRRWTGVRSIVRASLDPMEGSMMRRVVAAGLATVFLAVAAVPPVSAETGGQEKTITPQQQKMKDCAAKWKDEKAKTDAKGRD